MNKKVDKEGTSGRGLKEQNGQEQKNNKNKDKATQELLDILLNNLNYDSKMYSEQDLKVDLVIRLRVPFQKSISRLEQIKFDEVFKNLPPQFGKAYAEALEYINYLTITENDASGDDGDIKFATRGLTAITKIPEDVEGIQRQKNQKYVDNSGKIYDLKISCFNKFGPELDTFSVMYNTFMTVLERYCGFHVRAFIQENRQDNTENFEVQRKKKLEKKIDTSQKQQKRLKKLINKIEKLKGSQNNNKDKISSLQEARKKSEQNLKHLKKEINYLQQKVDYKVIYLLISQSQTSLIIQADKQQLKKEVLMADIDSNINQPTDSVGRPLRCHSYFRNLQAFEESGDQDQESIRQQKMKSFKRNEKLIYRTLQSKENNLQPQIFQQAQISKRAAKRYLEYSRKLNQLKDRLFHKQKMPISQQQLAYLFRINGQKENDKQFIAIYQKQKTRLAFYQGMKRLNKKYGYDFYQYDDTYFQLKLPGKTRPKKQKLEYLLTYKPYLINRNGQLSLFTKLQRIKLAYFTFQKYIKLQNFKKYGFEVYALNNNYQRAGQLTHQDNKHGKDTYDKKKDKDHETLQSAWSPFIPFFSKIKVIRDYVGQMLALEVLIKIYLVTFFLLVIPFSIASEFILDYYFKDKTTYRFCLIQLIVLVLTLDLFIVVWSKKQDYYFDNFQNTPKQIVFRDGYEGSYFRNLSTDQPNIHSQKLTFKQRAIGLVIIIIMGSFIVLQGLFFWGMRSAMVKTYQKLDLVQWQYLSFPHVTFYAVYFLVNQIVYNKIFTPFIEWLVLKQELATQIQHEQKVKICKTVITFTVQLMGPFFFTVLQPFRGLSCYSSACSDEFKQFIYARYIILFFEIFIKIVFFIIHYCKLLCGSKESLLKKIQGGESFSQRLDYLRNFVKAQYKMKQFKQDLRAQSLSLYYYVIFKVVFPFCTIFTFLYVQLHYVFERLQFFAQFRRPLPKQPIIFKLQETFDSIMHMCIIFHALQITYSYTFLEYDFSFELELFLQDNINDYNIFTLKMFISFVIVVIFEVISIAFRFAFNRMLYDPLQKRKTIIYQKYLLRVQEKLKDNNPQQGKLLPLKSVFRTYSSEYALAEKLKKQSKFKLMKQQKMGKISMFQRSNNSKDKIYQDQPAQTDNPINPDI